jgi:hypothetical protein
MLTASDRPPIGGQCLKVFAGSPGGRAGLLNGNMALAVLVVP